MAKKKINITQICSDIANREGKKVETSIGNIKEVVSVLANILAEDVDSYEVFIAYVATKRRAQIKVMKKVLAA